MSQATLSKPSVYVIDRLTASGYKVEDVGAEYGTAFAGRYRWLKLDGKELLDFQDDDMSDTPEAAWAAAADHYLSQP